MSVEKPPAIPETFDAASQAVILKALGLDDLTTRDWARLEVLAHSGARSPEWFEARVGTIDRAEALQRVAVALDTIRKSVAADLEFFRLRAGLLPTCIGDAITFSDMNDWPHSVASLHHASAMMREWDVSQGKRQPAEHREFLIDIAMEFRRLSGREIPVPPKPEMGGAFLNFALEIYRAAGRIVPDDHEMDARRAIVQFSIWWRKGYGSLPREWALLLGR